MIPSLYAVAIEREVTLDTIAVFIYRNLTLDKVELLHSVLLEQMSLKFDVLTSKCLRWILICDVMSTSCSSHSVDLGSGIWDHTLGSYT